MSKVSLPQGMRDFNAETVHRRNYILNTIKKVFELYGYEPLETPAMEQLTTLMGKYGEEGDRLIFRILNSGDFLTDLPPSLLSSGDSLSVSQHICEKGLRYDLTVPFARYVVQHRDEITFPFRRYHDGQESHHDHGDD